MVVASCLGLVVTFLTSHHRHRNDSIIISTPPSKLRRPPNTSNLSRTVPNIVISIRVVVEAVGGDLRDRAKAEGITIHAVDGVGDYSACGGAAMPEIVGIASG